MKKKPGNSKLNEAANLNRNGNTLKLKTVVNTVIPVFTAISKQDPCFILFSLPTR